MSNGPGTRHLSGAVVDDPGALEPIFGQWDDLAVAAGRPYCAPAWMLAWWRHAAAGTTSLRVITVSDGATLVGVAPFFAERTRSGLTRYRVLGAGTSSQVDLLAAPGLEAGVARTAAALLAASRPRPDVVMFEGIPSSSPWPAVLRDVWPGRRPTLDVLISMPAPFLALDEGGFDTWFGSRSSHYRARMRRGLRKLEARGGVIRQADPATLARDLKAFEDLHRSRWRNRGGSGVLTPGVEAMLADVAPGLLADDRLRVWMIDADGRPISAQLFVVAGGEVSYWLGGFDERWSDLHPGPSILTVLKAIEHAAGSGNRRMDLGAGEQAYKYEFAGGEENLDWTILALPTIRYPLSRLQLAPLRARMAAARALGPATKKKIRRLRSRFARN